MSDAEKIAMLRAAIMGFMSCSTMEEIDEVEAAISKVTYTSPDEIQNASLAFAAIAALRATA